MKPHTHHPTKGTLSNNKHSDPLKLYNVFPVGKRYRLWFTGVSEASYVEVMANQWAGSDPKTGKNYTFVECKMLHLDDETNGAGEWNPEVWYILAYEPETGAHGVQSENFFFTHSLGQAPIEIIMSTEINQDTIAPGYAPQVREILAQMRHKH